MAESFTVFEKFGNVCARLNKADRESLMVAICEYGMFGEEPDLEYPLDAIFEGMREDIDNSKTSRRKGASGGRPKRRQEVSETENRGFPEDETGGSENGKQLVSETENRGFQETETGGFQNEKPGVSENENPLSEKPETQTKPNQSKPDQTKGVRRFAPPARDEVRDYATGFAKEKRLDPSGFDAERFCDYYTANGWKVGRNPMKDWRAAVRDWVRRDCAPKGGANDEYSLL